MSAYALVKSYTAHVSELDNDILEQAGFALLPTARQKRIESFRSKQDKHLAIAAWLSLLFALTAEGLSLPAEDAWRVSDKGKLELSGGPHFNLSHSGNRVLCSICHEAEVGCDIEKIRTWKEKLAAFCMQEEEFAAMASLEEPSERAYAFTRSWTLKESYMKACSLGLKLAPKSFALRFDAKKMPQLANPEFDPCCFQEYKLGEGYCCSVCALAPKARFEALAHVELSQVLHTLLR